MADAEATRFEEVRRQHGGAISRVCRHFEASPEARRDLEQDVLVALWRALPSFRAECSERGFVLRIAHNVAVSHVVREKRAKVEHVDVPHYATASPDDAAHARTTLARIDARLRTLDLGSRQIVLLALEGCSTGEIAEVTGLSATNVTTRLSRLRKALVEQEEG